MTETNSNIEEPVQNLEQELESSDYSEDSFSMFESYIPERRYLKRKQYGTVRGYLPIGATSPSICESCVFYYKMLHDRGLTSSPDTPICRGHAARLLKDVEDMPVSREEIDILRTIIDPVVWVQSELNWKPYFYQSEYLSCLPGDQIIYMADGTFKALKDVNVGDFVLSYHPKRRVAKPKQVLKKFNNGIKDVVKVTLENGDTLECTTDHHILSYSKIGKSNPMLQLKSYKRSYRSIEEGLAPGDRVFVLNSNDIFGINNDVELAKLMGYISTDGYIKSPNSVQFINIRKMYVDEFEEIIKNKFPNSKITRRTILPYIDESGVHRQLTYSCFVSGEGENTLSKFLISINCIDRYTREDMGIEYAYRLSKEALLYFINRAYSGDGCIYTNTAKKYDSSAISMHGGNHKTLNKFRLLLRKLGIFTSKVYKKTEEQNSYYYNIQRVADIRRFFELIGPIYGKEKQSEEMIYSISLRGENLRRRFNCSSRMKIKSIEYIGPKEVFDIEVDKWHNYIANGFIVHNCTAYKRILRTSRQIGKTTVSTADILHKCFTNKNFKVLILTPFGPAIEEIFTILREHIDNSNNLRDSIISDIKNPQTIKFANGSRITGYPITPGDTKAVNKIRGQRCNYLYIDEADFIDPAHMQVILPIANKLETYVTMTSTPKGTKTIWTNLITNKNSGYKEFWYTLPERPDWTPGFSAQQSVFGQAGYTREYDAEITASAKGVFRKELVDASIERYDMDKITLNNIQLGVRILGVDWNKGAGAHIVLVGHTDGKFKLIKKWIINPDEFKQTAAVEKVIQINNEWTPEFIYIDEGYGDMQYEMLIKHGLQNPPSKLDKKVKKINMSNKIEIKNPKDGSVEKKWAKGFMYLNMAKLLQDNLLVLPQSEDTNSVLDDSVASAVGIVQQMREVELKKSSSIARAQFICPVDHTITAYGLALLGFTLNYSAYLKQQLSSAIFIGADYKPITSFAGSKSKDLQNIDRSLTKDKMQDRLDKVPKLEEIDDLKTTGIILSKKLKTDPNIPFGRRNNKDSGPYKRKNF